MILSIALYCIIQITAHELYAPARRVYDNAWRKPMGDIGIMGLIRLFSESRFIANRLPDGAFSATDEHSNHPVKFAKIRAPSYWAGKPGGINSITVDMTTSYLVTGVATKGMGTSREFVTRYEVHTSENDEDWRSHGVFVGNFDGVTVCKVRLPQPVVARFVKFTVVKYKHYPSMKVEVLVYEHDN